MSVLRKRKVDAAASVARKTNDSSNSDEKYDKMHEKLEESFSSNAMTLREWSSVCLYVASLLALSWYSNLHFLLNAGFVILAFFGVAPHRADSLVRFARVKVALGIDSSSLAALRIGLGCGVLLDLAFRSMVMTDFYTDEGVLPRDEYLSMCRQYSICDYEYPSTQSQQSVYLIGGSSASALLLWIIHTVAAIFFIVGYRTKLCSVLVWFMTYSLHMRNHFMNDKGAMTLRVYLLWGMMLPLGESGSVDSIMRSRKKRRRILSSGSVAFCVQVGVIYWYSIVYKWRVPDSSWKDGTALGHSFGMINYKKPFSSIMMAYIPYCSEVGTYLAVFMESLAPFLFFVPFLNHRTNDVVRAFSATLFICFHLTMGITLDLGIFFILSCIPFLAFFPGHAYETASRRLGLCKVLNVAVDGVKFVKVVCGFHDMSNTPVLAPAASRARRALGILAHTWTLFCAFYMLAWNRFHFDQAEYTNMPVKEIGAFVGLRQHWKLFTDMRPGTGHYEDCRPVLGGRINGTDDRTFSFMDYRLRRSRAENLESLIRPMNDTVWLRSEYPFRDYSHYHWKTYLLAVRGIDPLTRMLGNFVCDEWNRFPLRTEVTIDGESCRIEYTASMLEEVNIRKASHPGSRGKAKFLPKVVQDFCDEKKVTHADCWLLYDIVRKNALRMRMTEWFLYDVCDGKLKKPMQGTCGSEPEEPPRKRFGEYVAVDGIR